MPSYAEYIVGFCLLASVLAAVVLAFRRESRRRREMIAQWAELRGLSDVQLRSTSFRPHPQVGQARTGDVTYRLTAIDADGQPIAGYVKCNTFHRRRDMPGTIDSQLSPTQARGFPVQPMTPKG